MSGRRKPPAPSAPASTSFTTQDRALVAALAKQGMQPVVVAGINEHKTFTFALPEAEARRLVA